MAAPSPNGIVNAKEDVFRLQAIQQLLSEKGKKDCEVCHEKVTHQIDNTDASSLGFGRSPERSTKSSNDHHSKLCTCRTHFNWRSNMKNCTCN